MLRLLLVEDSRELAEWLGRLLRKSRYVVDTVHDGLGADTALATQTYDLVLLDLGLPEQSGIEVLRRYRARKGAAPVIVLTANDAISSRVAGLDAGADDYLIKPFDPQELEARIRAQVRRRRGDLAERIVFGKLEYDAATRRFLCAGEELLLTAREMAVLEALMLVTGRVVTKAALHETVFGFDDTVADNALEVYVHRVRKKIAGYGVGIVTLRGIGYALRQMSDA